MLKSERWVEVSRVKTGKSLICLDPHIQESGQELKERERSLGTWLEIGDFLVFFFFFNVCLFYPKGQMSIDSAIQFSACRYIMEVLNFDSKSLLKRNKSSISESGKIGARTHLQSPL